MRRSHVIKFAAWLIGAIFAILATVVGIFGSELNALLRNFASSIDMRHIVLAVLLVIEIVVIFVISYKIGGKTEEIESLIAKKTEEVAALTAKAKEEIENLKARNSDLVRQLQTDTKSGLSSYEFLTRTFDDQYVPAAQKGSIFSVLMIDIVEFKKINNTLGHDAGDEAISLVGGFLKSFVRDKRDLAARFGEAADEFFFIISGDAAALTGFSNRLRRELERESLESFELLKESETVLNFWSSGTVVTEKDHWETVKKRLMKGLSAAKKLSPDSTIIVAPE